MIPIQRYLLEKIATDYAQASVDQTTKKTELAGSLSGSYGLN